jgi:hypothetical protein
MGTVDKISISMDSENLSWVRAKAGDTTGGSLSAMLNKLVADERRREAHSRERVAESLKRWRERYPEPDDTLVEDMAKVRAVTNGDADP